MKEINEDLLNKVAYAHYIIEHIITKLNSSTKKITTNTIEVYLTDHKVKEKYSSKYTLALIKNYEGENNEAIVKVTEEKLVELAKMYEAKYTVMRNFITDIKSGKNQRYYDASKKYFDRLIKYFDVKKRMKAFIGTWVGKSIEEEGAYDMTCTIVGSSSNNVKGSIKIFYDTVPYVYDKMVYIDFKGEIIGMYDYIKLEYQNKEKSVIQFGTILLRLSGDANKLTGCFIGRGLTNEKICKGDVEIVKQSD